MPGGDRTGPRGAGPMTGRRAGFCAGYDVPGHMNPAAGFAGGMRGGRGWAAGGRMGGGRGRGFRHMYYATGIPGWARGGAWGDLRSDPEYAASELESLRREAEYLEERLKSLNEMIRTAEEDTGKDNG